MISFFLMHLNPIALRMAKILWLILLHSEQPKLHRVLAVLSAIGLIQHSVPNRLFLFQMPLSQGISCDNKDFESIVLMKMRQAEERKRLIEQMKKEDENS